MEFKAPSKNPHRAARLMVDVIRDLNHVLRELAGNSIITSIRMGDGHFCDRISDRSNDVEVAVRNVKYIITRLFTEKLCELLYIQEHCRITDQNCRCIVVYNITGTDNISICFDFDKRVPEKKISIRLRTYIKDYAYNDDSLWNTKIPFYRFDFNHETISKSLL